MTKALIVVDVQNDFCEGGSLAVPGGRQAARDISEMMRMGERKYATAVATKDFHLPGNDNGGHFSDNPDFVDTWPAHCLQDGYGSEFATPLHEGYFDKIFYKGQGKPSYSGFEGLDAHGRSLKKFLRGYGVDEVEICGIAYNYCVKATALDAVKAGFKTSVLFNYSPSIGDPTQTSIELQNAGVMLK